MAFPKLIAAPRPKKDEKDKLLKHLSLQISPQDFDELNALAAQQMRTVSAMARIAIRCFLDSVAAEDDGKSKAATARAKAQRDAR